MDRPPGVFARLSAYLPRKPWQLVLTGTVGLGVVGVLTLAVIVLVTLPTLPPVHELTDAELKVPLRVYTEDGDLIAEFGEEKRIPVKIEAVPPRLIQAIISAEDHNFYEHHGVDFLGVVRAAWHNFRTKSNAQGASTITMQVARNFFLSPEKTYTRKFKELLLALRIERELTKEQILELYINKIFLGHRAYGFAAAAQVYYGTKLDKLTLPQIAMLAGLPKAPSRDNPISNPENAVERRNYVLRHMQSLGYIDQATLDETKASSLTASRHSVSYTIEAPYVAEMVRQYMFQTYDEKAYANGFHVYTTLRSKNQQAANRALRDALLDYDERHGYRGGAAHVALGETPDLDRLDDVLKDYRIVGGLLPGIVTEVGERSASVYTQDGIVAKVDWDGLSWARRYIDENTVGAKPKKAGDILRRGDVVYLKSLNDSLPGESGAQWRLAQIPDVSGALVSLRPSDGAVLALVGGFDFYRSNFNRVTQAERQPGSSLKPFIYTAALEKGFTAASTVSGAPIVVEDANLEDEWRPENYSRRFYGPTRLRKALALSLNLVSIRLLRAIGPTYAADYLTRFGFDADKLPHNLSLALGNASATPLQMAAAYSVLANGGFRVQPYFIKRIEDGQHVLLEEAHPAVACPTCDPTTEGEQSTAPAAAVPTSTTTSREEKPGTMTAPRVLSPQIDFIMDSMLRDVVQEGTARRAKVLKRDDLAGKTGTTDEYRDAWFNGFGNNVVATAWVGFDQVASLGHGEAGSRAALPMWIDYMRVALDGVPEQSLEPPEGIVTAYVDSETGEPTSWLELNAIKEYFVKGTEGAATAGATDSTSVDVAGPTAPTEAPVPPDTDNIRQNLF
jgi:penicillin-binding protein 1A